MTDCGNTNAPVYLVLIFSLQPPPKNHEGDQPTKRSPVSSRNKVRPVTKSSLQRARLEPLAADHWHSGTGTERTLRWNREQLLRLRKAERCSKVTLGTDEENSTYCIDSRVKQAREQ